MIEKTYRLCLKKISVIIPVYNEAKRLKGCVAKSIDDPGRHEQGSPINGRTSLEPECL
ncbi:glycosyltransferase [Candidatus Bathyarchaeota archaeon]|nr:glycosyltransferase [Candidatus Bathyarchaeota archaeon]